MIHQTAIVHPGARLAEGVQVGAYSVIGEHVEIAEGTTVGPHVVIEGHTRIGRNNRIFQFCSIGSEPQDKKYAGEPTRLEIGDGNTIREFCSFSTGTSQDAGVTRVGNDNWIMAYVHIAHDCVVGDHTTMANNATLAGHVEVGDWATIGGLFSVVQDAIDSRAYEAGLRIAETLNRAADVGVQLCGARGYSKDTVLEWIYRYARCAKLVDGASEVHKMVLARFLQEEGREFWQWDHA